MAKRKTDEELLAIARQYRNQRDWKKADEASMQTARRRGREFFSRCIASMEVIKKNGYSHEELLQAALQHETRTDWFRDDRKTYEAARRKGEAFFAKCCEHMGPHPTPQKLPRGHWTFDRCLEDFLQWGSPTRWRDFSAGAYQASYKNDWQAKIYEAAGYESPYKSWTREACIEDAALHARRSDWWRASPVAYYKALRMGWKDECCAHMERISGHDNDAIYLWEWVEDGKGTGIYKVGLTSWRLDDYRIRACARDNGIDYRLIALCQTSEQDAKAFEDFMLNLGDEVALPDHIVDGRTEFRIFNDNELSQIRLLLGVA